MSSKNKCPLKKEFQKLLQSQKIPADVTPSNSSPIDQTNIINHRIYNKKEKQKNILTKNKTINNQ